MANSKTLAASFPSLATPSPSSLLALTDALVGGAVNAVSQLTYGPIIAACRGLVVTLLARKLPQGQLRIIDMDQKTVLGPAQNAIEVAVPTVEVIRDSFWLRLAISGDMGFAEAYMAGDCEVSDLTELFKVFIRSQTADPKAGISTLTSRALSSISNTTNSRLANTLSNSSRNISAHYDLSNAMFAAFLSDDMTYSCAIFREVDGDILHQAVPVHSANQKLLTNGSSSSSSVDKAVDELEEAQLSKIRHIIKKADIRSGHRVLEIGCGWGAFSIEAVRTTDCTIETITLSLQQKVLAEERIAAAGLAGSIRVWLMDYRALVHPASWKGQFDRVVSIEMIEAVGEAFIGEYFSVIDWALKTSGVACIQSITYPEAQFERSKHSYGFIQKYIFPGGFLPTITFLLEQASQGSENRLHIDSIGNIGPHYARTLREWQQRFTARFDDIIGPALRLEHPGMTDDDVQVFKRKWTYYFSYCEAGFAERILGVHILTFVREGYKGYACQIFA